MPPQYDLVTGYVDLLDGRIHEAQTQFRQALTAFEGENDRSRMIESLLALGDSSRGDDQLDEAASFYLRALRLARDLNNKRDVARAVRSVGIIAYRQHRLNSRHGALVRAAYC